MKVKTYSLIILAVIVFLCLVGWTSYAQKQGPTKVRWEYKVLDYQGESDLNQLGAQGWELVQITQVGSSTSFYLKRPK